MSPDQLRSTLSRLGLSQREAAAFLNWSERHIRNWIAGKWPVHPCAAKLLAVMVAKGLTPRVVARIHSKIYAEPDIRAAIDGSAMDERA